LDGVEGGAFEELIAADPEAESVVERAILANPAHGAIVLAGLMEGHGIFAAGRIVNDVQAWGLAEHVQGGLHGDGFFEFRTDGDGVGAVHRDARTQVTLARKVG